MGLYASGTFETSGCGCGCEAFPVTYVMKSANWSSMRKHPYLGRKKSTEEIGNKDFFPETGSPK
eukprot:5325907-Amphidinium_carterae.1